MFEQLFAINNVWLFPPDMYQEEPQTVVGYTTSRKPVRQGPRAWTFGWKSLKQEHMTRLMSLYNPALPFVTITYIEKDTGLMAQMTGMMEEPIVGARMSIFYGNVSVRFTHCH